VSRATTRLIFALLSLGQLKHVEKWALAWLAGTAVAAVAGTLQMSTDQVLAN